MGEGRDKLQRDLSSIATVAKSWNLNFNSECVIIRFGEQKLVREEVYFIEGKRFVSVGTHKDLGIVIDLGLRFHGHRQFSCWRDHGRLATVNHMPI